MSFKNYLNRKGLAWANQKTMLDWQASFEAWAAAYGKAPKALTTKDLMNYLQSEKGHLQRSSLETLLNRVKHYYNYLQVDNPLEDFSLSGICTKRTHNYLKAQELSQLEELIRLRPRIQLVNKLIWGLLIYQGLASSELPGLRVHQLDFKAALLHVGEGKLLGRSLPLQAVQIPLLLEFTSSKAPQDQLFNLPNTKKLHHKCDHLSRYIRQILTTENHPINFENLLQIRASRIAHWINAEGILRAQYLAGHHKLASTQRYETPATEQLRKGLLQAHPMFKP